MFWGLSPAVNLQDIFQTTSLDPEDPDHLSFLIVGGADCRHVLQTCARRYRYKKKDLHFQIVESCMETIAKQLLLFQVALQPTTRLGLQQKTKLFMEIFGNSLVRPSVAKYITSTAHQLINMITDHQEFAKITTNFTLNIKYKERDYLENLLKFWHCKDEFNINLSWDRRLRKLLGSRYDSKLGAFDWDLHMGLYNAGAKQICNQEYKSFRQIGVAFTWLESEVSKPNRSMVCGVVPNGTYFVHCGYLGDIETGPFIAFGLECEDETFLKSSNGQNSYRATDVTERNLNQIFYELENQDEYTHKPASDFQLGPTVLREEKLIIDNKSIEVIVKPAEKWMSLENVDIVLSSMDLFRDKKKRLGQYDVIYFGSSYIKHLTKEFLEDIVKDSTVILLECPRFVVRNRKKDLEEFESQIKSKLEAIKFLEIVDFDVHKNVFAKFRVCRPLISNTV